MIYKKACKDTTFFAHADLRNILFKKYYILNQAKMHLFYPK